MNSREAGLKAYHMCLLCSTDQISQNALFQQINIFLMRKITLWYIVNKNGAI